MTEYEHRRFYIGDPFSPYAQDQLNAAGRAGWELVQIINTDAWMKRAKETPEVVSTQRS